MFWNLKKCLPSGFFSDQSSRREDFFSSSKDNKYQKRGNKPGAGIANNKTQGCSRHCSRYSRSNAVQVGAQFLKYYFSERCTNFEICSHDGVCWHHPWHKHQPKPDKCFWSPSCSKNRGNDGGKNGDGGKSRQSFAPQSSFTEQGRGEEKHHEKKAGPGEPLFGKIPKMNEVLRRGYERRVSREWLGGILIDINVRNVI